MSYIDHKYCNLLSARLPRFKKVNKTTYNFRCVVCGDSQTNKLKTRGYLIEKGDRIIYYCHNCGASMLLGTFLKGFDVTLYKEYQLEKFKEETRESPPAPDITTSTAPKYRTTGPLRELKKISQLPYDHPAALYVKKRQIPSNFHYKLFYCSKFKQFVNSLIPDKFTLENDEPRLIIPFLDKEENCFGFQGRSFKKSGIRYITIILDDTKPKVFGLDTVDFKKPIYITEGPIDSMFLPNCIAMAGSDINDSLLEGIDKGNVTFVFDNEPRNKEICSKIERQIERGYNCVIWPESLECKDLNEMVLADLIPMEIIKNATYSGMKAKLKFFTWKKI